VKLQIVEFCGGFSDGDGGGTTRAYRELVPQVANQEDDKLLKSNNETPRAQKSINGLKILNYNMRDINIFN